LLIISDFLDSVNPELVVVLLGYFRMFYPNTFYDRLVLALSKNDIFFAGLVYCFTLCYTVDKLIRVFWFHLLPYTHY